MSGAQRSKAHYERRRRLGLCMSCERPTDGSARCEEHTAKARETQRRYHEKLLRDAGRRG